jgi:hypothetical protein
LSVALIKTFEGSFTVDPKVDPRWRLGDIVWIESKLDGLLRPTFRRRVQVIGISASGESTTYEVRSAPFVELPPA